MLNELDNIEIPLQEISTQQEGQELLETASNAEKYVKEIETSFIEQGTSFINEETQTYMKEGEMKQREIDGIEKAMTTYQEEVAVALKDTSDIDSDIKRIKERISDLTIEKQGIIEVINLNKDKLNSQIERIKQTIKKILDQDKTLGDRIKTLFKEQGITLFSIITAFGLIIGVIVDSLTGTTSLVPTPSPSPSPEPKVVYKTG
ncbi:unnamed protein product [Mytilus edulis]|uniref:Uncharacterized protein n=1 Tax=Mytilus edulis TaxID=6550 RepID=A0A8S3RCA1_MYTED|nr:unnamed protein product [Mytilus edulis]